jgi:hypothetical protein
LPITNALCVGLEQNPKLAIFKIDIEIFQPDDNFKLPLLLDLPIKTAPTPAALAILEPKKGLVSILLTTENNEILFNCIAEPITMLPGDGKVPE